MATSDDASPASSLPSPCPRSPLKYPDLYGKHRALAKVQKLEREIGFLEEELKSLEGFQPASRDCKEVDDFVGATPDPLIPINRKIRRSYRFWKWPWCSLNWMVRTKVHFSLSVESGKSCFNLSWIFCCFSGCSLHLETPSCCPSENWWCCGRLPCHCHCHCLEKISCRPCCILPAPSCSDCLCSRCKCSFPRCTKVCLCSNCTKTWCNPFYPCY